MRDTWPRLEQIAFPPIRRGRLETLQVNIGYRCNQSCVHCHVNAGPNRTEEMSSDMIDAVLAFLARKRVARLTLPAVLRSSTRTFAAWYPQHAPWASTSWIAAISLSLKSSGRRILPQFLAGEQVEIVASLPCYLEDNVDRQRGKGVFEASIRGLQKAQCAWLWARRDRARAQPRV